MLRNEEEGELAVELKRLVAQGAAWQEAER